MQLKSFFYLFLFLISPVSVYSQSLVFDSLANEINKISLNNRTKSLEILDSLYKMAYNNPDSSLLISRALCEEVSLNKRQGIVDTLLTGKIKRRLSREHLSPFENTILLYALGVNIASQGEYSEAFTIHLQTLERCKQLQDKHFIAKVLNSLGNICFSISLNNLAEYYYSEALKHAQPKSYEYYSIKSNSFIMLSKIDRSAAVDSMLSLIEIVKRDNFKEFLPYFYLNIGTFIMDTLPERALTYFNKVQNAEVENAVITAALYGNMGYYYYMKKEYSKAIGYFKNTQEIKNIKADLKLYTYYWLSHIFEEQNQKDSALLYARRYENLIQEIRSNIIALETHQKLITTILADSQKDLTIAEQKIALRNSLFVLFAIILLAAILLILLFQQQKNRKASENRELSAKLEHEKKVQQYEKRQRQLEKEKQKEVLDAKVREISSYSLLVSYKNNLLRQIREYNAQAINNNEDSTKAQMKIEEIIHSNFNMDEEWDNFKMHFEKVHPHFFKKLKKMGNELTEENMKLIAYLKMGMSTKQIAQMLNITEMSVSKSRQRIKKKLKLEEQENLAEFIGSL